MDIRAEFERCAPWLEAALEYANDTHTVEDIWRGVVAGNYQFWPADRAAMVTEILSFPKRRVLHIFLGGGDLDQLLDMEKALSVYAKTLGCKSITISGRKGWTRVLESRGYAPLCVTVAKELEYE